MIVNKRVLLVEPGYKNKYPPLGLMKLAAYHKQRGHVVKFVKGEDYSVLAEAWDRVYVTTLFTFEWNRTSKTIDYAIQVAGNQPDRVFVGGIATSLMHNEFLNEPRWMGVRFISGLLLGPPSSALQLSSDDGDFGSNDFSSRPIEEHVPDYGILDDISYTYPVNDAYFGYASRGCVRKCRFCGVPKLEGAMKEMPPLSELITGVSSKFGVKKDLILMDNNITASARYRDVIAEIRDLGFEVGAKLDRSGKHIKRRVDFNQGVDARILVKSSMYLKELSSICINPLRIAFDHIGVRKVYESSVRTAAEFGITSLSNYMLYNFMDTPDDLYSRMQLNITLNEELGTRIWSFPMRYQPVTIKDRSHVGKNWNSYFLRSFQIMLQATHGVVSSNPSFFYRAFGSNCEEFKTLLSFPHRFIFNRNYYQFGEGNSVREEYVTLRSSMTSIQQQEFLNYLTTPIGGEQIRRKEYIKIVNSKSVDFLVRQAISFHIADHTRDKQPVSSSLNTDLLFPNEEEIVEDAGLFENEPAIQSTNLPNKSLLLANSSQ